VAENTFQSIIINLRNAAVDFCQPYKTPGNIPTALKELLKQLGINDPGAAVLANLNNAVQNWGNIGRQLENLNLDVINIQDAIKDLENKANTVRSSIDQILNTPNAIWNTMGASGAAIKAVFPRRLIDYIIYEALTKSHKKIGGVFLLFGVLRREFTPAASSAFINAEIRIFDLAQLLKVVTHPREAILDALKWGTDDFNARPLVDGMVLLADLVPNTTAGPDEQQFSKTTENLYVDRGNELNSLRESARHTLTVHLSTGGDQTIEFVGLHKTGIGLLINSPFSFSGNLSIPELSQPGAIFALTPGPDRLTSPPKVEVLTP
jgi:sulfur carrier protein ThiS